MLGGYGKKDRNGGKGSLVSLTGTGPMVQKAARLMASRDLQQHWPASAAAQPSPGGAITTTAPVSVWAPRVEGHPHNKSDQGKGLLSVSQFREVWVGVRVH